MENIPLGIALTVWFAFTVWMYNGLLAAGKRIDSVLSETERLRADKVGLLTELNRMHDLMRSAKPSSLPEIYTPEQFDACQVKRNMDREANTHARRWHEQQKDVSKALKWDDAAKGEQ